LVNSASGVLQEPCGFPIIADRHRFLLLLACLARNLDLVMRRLMSTLLVLSLLWATAPAFATSIECAMPETMMDMTNGKHEQMDCCTVDCFIACPTAALLPADIDIAGDRTVALLRATFLPTPPASVSPQLIDPPPRVHLT
jgi:hypothetical protein